VNFVDIYIRTGLYPAALPSGLGTEAAGVVEDVGPGVDHIKAGDRVAYAGGPLGAYSEVRVMPADRLVALPQGISDQQGEPRSTRQGQGLVVVHDHLAAARAGRCRFAGKAGRDWRALTVAGTGVNLSAPAKPNSQERPLRK
jgi:hypothetical protein